MPCHNKTFYRLSKKWALDIIYCMVVGSKVALISPSEDFSSTNNMICLPRPLPPKKEQTIYQ